MQIYETILSAAMFSASLFWMPVLLLAGNFRASKPASEE
jgi:hypothetical protein